MAFSFLLYLVGLLGMIFNYKNFLVTMMSIEMMYLGAVSSFVIYSTVTNDVRGAIYGLLLLILAACESAIGLGILIVLYRFGRAIDFNSYQQLGG
ncbi:MAG: NADH-quinone oxidoreductase subunit NuoK [Bdellovibrio sp.]